MITTAISVPRSSAAFRRTFWYNAGKRKEMIMSGKDFWDEYFEYWDQFLKQWADRCEALTRGQDVPYPDDGLTTHLAKQFEASGKNNKSRLVYDELPEPYYGDPKKAKCILIQFNPGKSSDVDWTKFYSRRKDPNAFLIRSFLGIGNNKTNCSKLYNEFARHWSSLNATYPDGVMPSEVCGHDWWHGNRKRWIKSFSGADLKDVFVVETCPYHSLSWAGEGLSDEYLMRRVIVPAVMAAKDNKLGYVISASSDVCNYLKKNGVTKVATWRNMKDSKTACVKLFASDMRYQVNDWPINQEGNSAEHKYDLYELSQGGYRCYFLYVKTNNMNYPSDSMNCVQDGILEFIKECVVGRSVDGIVKKQLNEGRLVPMGEMDNFSQCLFDKARQKDNTNKKVKKEVNMPMSATNVFSELNKTDGVVLKKKQLDFKGKDGFAINTNKIEPTSFGKLIYRVEKCDGSILVRLYTAPDKYEQVEKIYNGATRKVGVLDPKKLRPDGRRQDGAGIVMPAIHCCGKIEDIKKKIEDDLNALYDAYDAEIRSKVR